MANEISKKVDAYLEKFPKWKDGMHTIREIMLATELEEEVKWGMPTYRINGKNVVSFAGFKNHYGVWFHQGGLINRYWLRISMKPSRIKRTVRRSEDQEDT